MLVGSEKRPADPRAERTLAMVQQDVHAAARKPPEAPGNCSSSRVGRIPACWPFPGRCIPMCCRSPWTRGVSPPLVWVANGSGPGRLLQLAGDDLSVKADLGDNGQTLSCPRQDGGQPVLNIDPQTGHLYIEDDSNYRLKQYGTVYRLDPQGNVLKKWPPTFFNTDRLNATSPWWLPDPERHFRFPNEPLSIDSIFGKDGRIYRWQLGKAGVEILRFDRSGTADAV